MNKVQKYEQTKGIESYLEEKDVKGLFKNLLKQLLVNKPDKPLDFLIEKLQNPRRKLAVLCNDHV